eukprot:8078_1
MSFTLHMLLYYHQFIWQEIQPSYIAPQEVTTKTRMMTMMMMILLSDHMVMDDDEYGEDELDHFDDVTSNYFHLFALQVLQVQVDMWLVVIVDMWFVCSDFIFPDAGTVCKGEC